MKRTFIFLCLFGFFSTNILCIQSENGQNLLTKKLYDFLYVYEEESSNDNLDNIEQIINEQGHLINGVDGKGFTPLLFFICISDGMHKITCDESFYFKACCDRENYIVKVVEKFLEKGADSNFGGETDFGMFIPIHQAIRRFNFEIVQLLVKYNANINTLGDQEESRTPLDLVLKLEKENFDKKKRQQIQKVKNFLTSKGAKSTFEVTHNFS